MATAAFYLDTRRELNEGGYPLKVRISHKRKSRYFETIYAFQKDYWEKICAGKYLDDRQREIRKKTDALLKKADGIIEGMDYFTFGEFESKFTGESGSHCLIARLNELEKKFRSSDKISSARITRQAADSVIEYSKKTTFPVSEITPDWLQGYQEYYAKKVGINTVIFRLSKVRRVLNDCVADGSLKPERYPFNKGREPRKYKMPKAFNNKRPIEMDEVQSLYNYKPKSGSERLAIDMIIFSYISGGMNMADIFDLKWKDIGDDSLSFTRLKTADKVTDKITVPLTDEHREIIKRHGVRGMKNDYVFGVYDAGMDAEQKDTRKRSKMNTFNNILKRIFKKMGYSIRPSTIFARHGFTTTMSEEGAPIALISQMLGHQSISTTQNYLSQFKKEKAEKYLSAIMPKKNGA